MGWVLEGARKVCCCGGFSRVSHFVTVIVCSTGTGEEARMKLYFYDSARAFNKTLSQSAHSCYFQPYSDDITMINQERTQGYFDMGCGYFAEAFIVEVLEKIRSGGVRNIDDLKRIVDTPDFRDGLVATEERIFSTRNGMVRDIYQRVQPQDDQLRLKQAEDVHDGDPQPHQLNEGNQQLLVDEGFEEAAESLVVNRVSEDYSS
jgi:hypothetical protein